jgi:hypothetical protein
MPIDYLGQNFSEGETTGGTGGSGGTVTPAAVAFFNYNSAQENSIQEPNAIKANGELTLIPIPVLRGSFAQLKTLTLLGTGGVQLYPGTYNITYDAQMRIAQYQFDYEISIVLTDSYDYNVVRDSFVIQKETMKHSSIDALDYEWHRVYGTGVFEVTSEVVFWIGAKNTSSDLESTISVGDIRCAIISI